MLAIVIVWGIVHFSLFDEFDLNFMHRSFVSSQCFFPSRFRRSVINESNTYNCTVQCWSLMIQLSLLIIFKCSLSKFTVKLSFQQHWPYQSSFLFKWIFAYWRRKYSFSELSYENLNTSKLLKWQTTSWERFFWSCRLAVKQLPTQLWRNQTTAESAGKCIYEREIGVLSKGQLGPFVNIIYDRCRLHWWKFAAKIKYFYSVPYTSKDAVPETSLLVHFYKLALHVSFSRGFVTNAEMWIGLPL